jgi:lipid-binding SYLF domain-containing protein
VEPDNEANYRLYGKTLTETDIVRGTDVKPSTERQSLVAVLDSKLTKYSK